MTNQTGKLFICGTESGPPDLKYARRTFTYEVYAQSNGWMVWLGRSTTVPESQIFLISYVHALDRPTSFT